jgi:hypothetical protein
MTAMLPLRYPTPTPPRPANGGDFVDLEHLDRPELDEPLDDEPPTQRSPTLPALEWEEGEESGVKKTCFPGRAGRG